MNEKKTNESERTGEREWNITRASEYAIERWMLNNSEYLKFICFLVANAMFKWHLLVAAVGCILHILQLDATVQMLHYHSAAWVIVKLTTGTEATTH